MSELNQTDKNFLQSYNADEYKHPSVTVDMLIFTTDLEGSLELLLIKRKHPPFQGCWAIPGGFLEVDDDRTLEDAAMRELMEETNISDVHMEQLYTFGDMGRDPRTRVISVAYLALVPKGKLKAVAGDDAAEAEWFKVNMVNGELQFNADISLAFDHEKIVKTAIERMRGKISYVPIAFEFLNNRKRFTIYELQKIYEAVLGRKLDAANFRRSFLMNYVNKGLAEEIGEKCTEFGHRPSMYYKYLNKSVEDFN